MQSKSRERGRRAAARAAGGDRGAVESPPRRVEGAGRSVRSRAARAGQVVGGCRDLVPPASGLLRGGATPRHAAVLPRGARVVGVGTPPARARAPRPPARAAPGGPPPPPPHAAVLARSARMVALATRRESALDPAPARCAGHVRRPAGSPRGRHARWRCHRRGPRVGHPDIPLGGRGPVCPIAADGRGWGEDKLLPLPLRARVLTHHLPLVAEATVHHAVQSSARRSGTWRKSRRFLVSSVDPVARTMAAIRRSIVPTRSRERSRR